MRVQATHAFDLRVEADRNYRSLLPGRGLAFLFIGLAGLLVAGLLVEGRFRTFWDQAAVGAGSVALVAFTYAALRMLGPSYNQMRVGPAGIGFSGRPMQGAERVFRWDDPNYDVQITVYQKGGGAGLALGQSQDPGSLRITKEMVVHLGRSLHGGFGRTLESLAFGCTSDSPGRSFIGRTRSRALLGQERFQASTG
jgi:hypothetical protein